MRNTHIPPVSVEKLYLKSKKMETQVKSLLLNNTVNEKNASGTIPYNLPEHNWKVDLKTVTSSPKDEKKRSSRKIHVSPRVDKKISQRSLIGDSKAMLNVSINDSVDIPRIDPDNSEDKDKYVKK